MLSIQCIQKLYGKLTKQMKKKKKTQTEQVMNKEQIIKTTHMHESDGFNLYCILENFIKSIHCEFF